MVRTLRRGHNATRVGCNIDTGDGLVMPFQLVLELECIASSPVKLDGRVPRDGQSRSVGGERVVGNRVVK